jgi:ribosomal protein L11 methyltransferase
MIDYMELQLTLTPFYPANELATVWCAEYGFESFLEEAPCIKAYIPKALFDTSVIQVLQDRFSAQGINSICVLNEIPAQNWNQVWEDSFEPVLLEHLSIVAPFHGAEYRLGRVIEIEPKMSFGTGHHQTTTLMCQAMEHLSLADKVILDMGTGTGILAINAEQLGARKIIAVDIEPWSVENTRENAQRNLCTRIEAREGDMLHVTERDFDLILANINRNVLLRHIEAYYQGLMEDGLLLLSGFFTTDVSAIQAAAKDLGFKLIDTYEKENWACMLLKKG